MIRILALLSMTFFLACGNSAQSGSSLTNDYKILKTEIEGLAKLLDEDQSGKVDKTKAEALIDRSLEFVKSFPKDNLSAGYLFRAADVCVGIGKYQKAIDYWGQVNKQFPDFERAPMAIFFQGFTADNHLEDKGRARTFYQLFMDKYPNHPKVPQAKLLLDQLDISPEELIKEFKNKNKK